MTDNAVQKSVSSAFFFIFWIAVILFFCLFMSLFVWQVQRLGWKNDLVARVNERIHFSPVPAPSRTGWSDITEECCDYLPVYITGRYLNEKEVLVTTLTSQGTGYWLITPLQTKDGAITFINRGFVPMDKKEQDTRSFSQIYNETTVSGLLRMGEKNGFYPRRNNPSADIWYTRELPAMAKARGLAEVAPYFIDADKTENEGGIPVGGLTVIRFPNNHFIYAVTWFILAAGVLFAAVFIIFSGKKRKNSAQKI